MILVVDDDKNIRLSLWFILKQGESQTPKAVSEKQHNYENFFCLAMNAFVGILVTLQPNNH